MLVWMCNTACSMENLHYICNTTSAQRNSRTLPRHILHAARQQHGLGAKDSRYLTGLPAGMPPCGWQVKKHKIGQ